MVLAKIKWLSLLFFVLSLTISVSSFTACSQRNAKTLTAEESRNRVLQAAVHVAAIGLGEMIKNVSDENQRIEIIRQYIEPIRFFDDRSGYLYVYDYNGVSIAHAVDKSLLAKNLSDFKEGNYAAVVRKLAVAARKGGGYETFDWPFPVTKVVQRKIDYVEPLPNTDFFIGSGYFPDAR
jgi:signal transduction histidine kinase